MHPNVEGYIIATIFNFLFLIVNILVGRCKLGFNYV